MGDMSPKHFPLFADVPTAEFEAIMSGALEKRFSYQEIIYTEGDPVTQVTLLLSGLTKLTKTGVNGTEVILRLSSVGEILGSYILRANCTHHSTATAVRPCTALVWDAKVFEDLQARIPVFRRNLMRALEERLEEMKQRLEEVSNKSVGFRLMAELGRVSRRRRTLGSRPV